MSNETPAASSSVRASCARSEDSRQGSGPPRPTSPVARCPLTATGFAIADNRTAELAGWDEAVLQKLLAEVEGPNPELTRMLDDLAASFQAELDTGDEAQDDKAAGDDELPPELFQVLVTGREGRPLAEADQVELLEEFVRRGYQVKALTS